MTQAAAPTQSPPDSVRTTSRFRRRMRFIGWILVVVVGWLILVGMIAWSSLAVQYADLSGAPPRNAWALAVAVAMLGALLFVRRPAWAGVGRLLRPHPFGLAAFLGLFIGVLIWYLRLQPSNERDWSPDVSRTAFAEIAGDQITLHNVRNFDYRTNTDYTPRWDDRTYNLANLRGVDMILCYWGSHKIAHGIVSFEFDNNDFLAASIEVRRQKSQSFSALRSLFRDSELIYVFADERDVIRVRTNCRDEDLYLYRTKVSPRAARMLLLGYLKRANELHQQPQWYNALTMNCVTSVVDVARESKLPAHLTWKTLLSGYAAEQAYENGRLDTSMPYPELERRSRITDAAIAADKDPDFSQRIRRGLPSPVRAK